MTRNIAYKKMMYNNLVTVFLARLGKSYKQTLHCFSMKNQGKKCDSSIKK